MRRRLPRRRVAQSLARGACMFAPTGSCSGDVCAQPLDTSSLVLVCDGHLERFFTFRRDFGEYRRMKRYLAHAFGLQTEKAVH